MSGSLNRWLAVLALALGTLAAVVGARTPPTTLAVDAVTLAGWIRARRAVTVLDLRDADTFATFHVPTARRPERPVAELATRPADTLVLVGDGSGAAATTAVALRHAAATVRWLDGGVEAWSRDVLNPTIAEDAPDSAFARFGRVAELSRYFGGLPRVLPPGAADDSGRRGINATVRRGCGF